jgi:hypothetical protein
MIFNECGGETLETDGKVPRQLKRKVKFMKGAFKKLAPLEAFATEGLLVLAKIPPVFRKRDELVHGAITDEDLKPKDGAFTFRIIGHIDNSHTMREFKFHLRDFSILQKELSDLLTEGLGLSMKIGDALLGRPE